ncbi:MAG: LysM peptidoglycan-binding domain-containing protein [Spirochaetales bacterium]|nr:MAG: LysM peptidoglycan-binding domain-containing protein [Spirochaetales bacterium]
MVIITFREYFTITRPTCFSFHEPRPNISIGLNSNMRKISGLLLLILAPFVFSADLVHIVKKNETLFGIAKEYNIPLELLLTSNDVKDPKSLKIGMNLRIPGTWTVKKGDTLYKIAKDCGTTVKVLQELNNLKAESILKPGEVLLLPLSTAPPAVKEPVTGTSQIAAAESDDGGKAGTEQSGETGSSSETAGAGSADTAPDGVWPLKGERMILEGKLAGAQIAGNRGDSVLAVNSGQVIWEGPYRGFGRVIIIEALSKYIYVYGGNETSLVQVGDRVTLNMEIAKLGTNPHEGRAMLFFSVFKDGKPVDPEKAPRI